MSEQPTRPLIQIDDELREMTEEEHAELMSMQSAPSLMKQEENNAN